MRSVPSQFYAKYFSSLQALHAWIKMSWFQHTAQKGKQCSATVTLCGAEWCVFIGGAWSDMVSALRTLLLLLTVHAICAHLQCQDCKQRNEKWRGGSVDQGWSCTMYIEPLPSAQFSFSRFNDKLLNSREAAFMLYLYQICCLYCCFNFTILTKFQFCLYWS